MNIIIEFDDGEMYLFPDIPVRDRWGRDRSQGNLYDQTADITIIPERGIEWAVYDAVEDDPFPDPQSCLRYEHRDGIKLESVKVRKAKVEEPRVEVNAQLCCKCGTWHVLDGKTRCPR